MSEQSQAPRFTINVSPDDLPLDIELASADDLPAVIRAIQECHSQGQASPSPTDPHDDKQDAAIYAGQALDNVATEKRRDWITDRLNEWYSSHTMMPIPDHALNALILKVDDMLVGSGAGDLCIENEKLRARIKELEEAMRPQYIPEAPVPISEASYQRARKMFATWQAEGVTYNIVGHDAAINFFASKLARVFDDQAAPQPDPFKSLAQEYEKREIDENLSSVGYMRERIRELEAEKQQLASLLHQKEQAYAKLQGNHSNQREDLEKLFDMIGSWGWSGGNWSEWLQVYVDTIVKNCQKANADANELGIRLNMRNGELQAAIDLKNELLDENKKVVAENIHLRREHARKSDQLDVQTGNLELARADVARLEKRHDRLVRKYNKLRSETQA